ncbi:uncharacterized protein F5891DRAFT_1195754 [Suillus fuscotomentosus]|uniref:Uncharacterized protein n=1 Tax=Suillus fuscotomentosus TaxID=1912939 RepID=A0AAD4DU21_9AGAM|nr:uncharacterized protein F5891DRAFT_1195754 [Suillus fuscotomentosus]KAG1893950.1 hypothetical protein F5891DRAFT_1195754 [Suillus fuscotomentosus]
MSNIMIPPALDSRRVTLELTTHLCSQDHLLHGIDEIMKFEHSEDAELQRHGRKIISLAEVARSTLRRLNVGLYLFIACSEALLPFKSAYFKLLLFIERRKHAFGTDLNERISRLLDPLYTRFVVCGAGVDPRDQLGIEGLPPPPDIPAAWKIPIQPEVPATKVPSAQQQDVASDTMLPPDAFEKKMKRLARLGEFIKDQAAKKFLARRARKQLMQKARLTGNPGEKRLVPKQYATGNPETGRLVPQQCATGNKDAGRLVPKQCATGNKDTGRHVPNQNATGNPEERRLAPKQYGIGKPGAKRMIPPQYPAGRPKKHRVLVPKLAGDAKLGTDVKPACPGRMLTRTYAQFFD